MIVILAHGLARTPLSTWRLSRHLEKHGFTTESFGYAAYLESFDRIVRRLRTRIEATARSSEYAIVCHSLGGVLARVALTNPSFPLPRHIVMLGTPNNRSRMAEWATKFTPWGLFVGQAGRKLAQSDFFATLDIPNVKYTVIAGTKGPAKTWIPPFYGLANDTLVAVEETSLGVGETLIELPISHTFMPSHRRVLPIVLNALQQR